MRNITLSFPDDVIKRGKAYAHRRGISLNALVRDALRREIEQEEQDATGVLLDVIASTGGRSAGWRWSRDELYDR
ncbi:MAG: ribbon-helix-helix domain-containing protein [Spirochaeta sp.]|nr:ribbon-helix-helix domain-containing protein [Spirochaeta sp.]